MEFSFWITKTEPPLFPIVLYKYGYVYPSKYQQNGGVAELLYKGK